MHHQRLVRQKEVKSCTDLQSSIFFYISGFGSTLSHHTESLDCILILQKWAQCSVTCCTYCCARFCFMHFLQKKFVSIKSTVTYSAVQCYACVSPPLLPLPFSFPSHEVTFDCQTAHWRPLCSSPLCPGRLLHEGDSYIWVSGCGP